jgi:uncharacterized protein (TIGR00730 family)
VTVLGPGTRGVIVATRDLQSARRDREWLEDAGIPAAIPADLGLRSVRSVLAFTTKEPDRDASAAEAWSRATRRPAIASTGDRVHVSTSDRAELMEGVDALSMIWDALEGPQPERVSVFGGAWAAEDQPDYGSARELGRGLAREGAEIVCGGYQGIMAAVCRGCKEVTDGLTVGITVEPWSAKVPLNEWVDHVVEARDLFARLPLIADADAWVAFPGGVGTLKEVALCWNLVQNGLAEPRPFVLVGERWARLLEAFRDALIVSDPSHFDLLEPVATAEEALGRVRASISG